MHAPLKLKCMSCNESAVRFIESRRLVLQSGNCATVLSHESKMIRKSVAPHRSSDFSSLPAQCIQWGADVCWDATVICVHLQTNLNSRCVANLRKRKPFILNPLIPLIWNANAYINKSIHIIMAISLNLSADIWGIRWFSLLPSTCFGWLSIYLSILHPSVHASVHVPIYHPVSVSIYHANH